MRINRGDMTDPPQVELDQSRPAREVVENAAPPAQPAGGSAGSDSIAITGISGLVQQALSAGAAERADLVQQLKQLIESGQYTVDPLTVSRALLSAHVTTP